MKSKFFLVSILALSPVLCALSQVPQGFNYQAIARNSGGTEIPNATIKVKLSVLSDTTGFRAGTGGVYVWEEEHTNVKTNSFGMFTIVLGSTSASKVQGSAATFSAIDWSVANLYVGTKIANPTTYTVMGAAKLWSVPYALRSQESGQWTTSGANIYRPSGAVGIGTPNPSFNLEVVGNVLFRNPSATGYTTLRLYNDQNINVRALEIDYMGSSYASGEQGRIHVTGNYPLNLMAGSGIISLNSNGRVGIGITNPLSKLSFGNYYINSSTPTATEQTSTVRLYDNGDGSVTYGFGVSSNALNIAANQSTGSIRFYTNAVERFRVDPSGNIGIGTTLPTSKMVIQPSATWDDNTPLFEVKNKYGFPVLAVYNNGVRILVEDTDGKGAKGGFAVGGFDPTKAGETVNLMTVSADSVRFNIDNNTAKAAKGGFAVGSFDNTKAVSSKAFMHLTPQSSDDGQYNTFVGYQTGKSNTTGAYNVLLGYRAGYSNLTGMKNYFIGYTSGFSNTTGRSNIFLGDSAGYASNGNFNIFIGNKVGAKNTSGNLNVFLGQLAGGENTTGLANTFIGFGSGSKNTSGFYNVSIGSVAGYQNTTGSNNITIGAYAGAHPNPKTATGSDNIFIGTSSGSWYTTGYHNIAVGKYSQFNLSDGYKNVSVGQESLNKNISGLLNVAIGDKAGYKALGNGNVFLGYAAGYNETGSDKLYIANSDVSSTLALIYGQFDFWSTVDQFLRINGKLGVLRTAATNQLEVEGTASKTTAGDWLANSDARIKCDISDIDNAKEIILQLRPVKFRYSDDWRTKHPSIEDKYYYNFIAQEYSLVFPESVKESGEILDENPVLQMDSYNAQIVAIKAVQDLIIENREQKTTINNQEARIVSLEKRISDLEKLISEIAEKN